MVCGGAEEDGGDEKASEKGTRFLITIKVTFSVKSERQCEDEVNYRRAGGE